MVKVKKLTLLEFSCATPPFEKLKSLCGTTARADLYIFGGKFRLLIRQDRFPKSGSINSPLSSRLEVSKTLEYGKCILKNAVIRAT